MTKNAPTLLREEPKLENYAREMTGRKIPLKSLKQRLPMVKTKYALEAESGTTAKWKTFLLKASD